jgi:hypothetical protein
MQKARRFNGEDFHNLLMMGIPYDLELIEGIPVYCKIECTGQYGPCKFMFTYRGQGEIRVFASLTDIEPSEDQNNTMLNKPGRPKVFTVRESYDEGRYKRGQHFKNDFIYLKFLSPNKCDISVKAMFAEHQKPMHQNNKKKCTTHHPEDIEEHEMSESLTTLRNIQRKKY